MGVRLGQQNAYIRERAKWEHEGTLIDPQWVEPTVVDGVLQSGFMDGVYVTPIPRSEGGRAGRIFEPYPKAVYRAGRPNGTAIAIIDQARAEDEGHESRLRALGYHDGQEAAIAAVRAMDQELATLSANRNFSDRRMSDKAQAESLAAQELSSQHLATIPEKPKRKYVKKTAAA